MFFQTFGQCDVHVDGCGFPEVWRRAPPHWQILGKYPGRAPRKGRAQEMGGNGVTLKERERERREKRGAGNKERERSRERNEGSWDFPGSPVVKTPHFQCGRLWVQALVGELRTHMLCRATKRNEKKENGRREGKGK